MRMCHGGGATTIRDGGATRDLAFRWPVFGSLFRLFRGGFGLGACGLFSAERLHLCGFDAGCFSSCRFCLGGGFGGRVRRGGSDRGLLLRGCLHVGGFSSTTNGFGGGGWRRRNGFGWSAHRCTTATRRRSGRGLLLSARAFIPLPSGTNSSDLVVGEHAHVAADRNVHLPEKCDHFFGRHRELVRQLTD